MSNIKNVLKKSLYNIPAILLIIFVMLALGKNITTSEVIGETTGDNLTPKMLSVSGYDIPDFINNEPVDLSGTTADNPAVIDVFLFNNPLTFWYIHCNNK